MKKMVVILICCGLVLCQFSCTPRQEKPNPADIRIVAGDEYGCDLVCWFDEIGICYDLEQEIAPEECYVTIWGSESEEYPYYLIYLHYGFNGSKNFFLGDLWYYEGRSIDRYILKPLNSDFNTGNLLLPKANRNAEEHPMEQESGGFLACTNLWTDLWGTYPAEQHETWTDMMGTIRAYDAEKYRIGITEGLEYGNMPLEEYHISEGPIGDDLIALQVPESAMLCLYLDSGAVLVTREYFFKMLEWDYIGFETGGRLLFDGDVLLGYSEIMYPCLD